MSCSPFLFSIATAATLTLTLGTAPVLTPLQVNIRPRFLRTYSGEPLLESGSLGWREAPKLAQVVTSDTGGFQSIDKFATPDNMLDGHTHQPHEQKALKAEAMLGIKRLFEKAAQQ